MQIDRYTKIVLTIIAASLVALVAQNAMKPAIAQTGTLPLQKVVLCDFDNHCAGVGHTDYESRRGALAVFQVAPAPR